MAEALYALDELQQDFNDQQICRVCLHQYTYPKILPCYHSFCLKCIEPLPIQMKKDGNYIRCPTCHINHKLPKGDALYLPNAFQIISVLESQKKATLKKCAQMTCPKHNDLLKFYCEACCELICRYCAISKEHSKHHSEPMPECYPKHHRQIQVDFNQLKHKAADIKAVVTALVTREREVEQRGEDIKNEIHTHAQHLIHKVQRSERHLIQQVSTIVQQKRHTLTKQREQADRVLTQLNTCQEMVEQSLKEWDQQQVMMEKKRMQNQMKMVSKHAEPTAYQPIEQADIMFMKTENIKSGIGNLTSKTYGKTFLKPSPCSTVVSTATLTLQSHDGSPLSLPSSLISCKLSSTSDKQPIQCSINQTQQGEYNISFLPYTRGEYQLIVQVGGIEISGSPFILPVIPSSLIKGKPAKTITGLNWPYGIAVCDSGDIAIAENSANCVTIVNKKGKKVGSFGTSGTMKGQFTYPCGVAASNDGHILVTDNHRLQKLTFDGVCVKSVGSSESGSGSLQYTYPRGIAVHRTTGQIFVADSYNHRIQVFTNNLTFSHSIILCGDKRLDSPCDVVLDEGYLYISEFGNHCITKLTTTGQYITRFGSHGSAPGQLSRPSSLTIFNNLVYIGESGNRRVSIFNTEGTFLHCFGTECGRGELGNPLGITTDALGNLYVSDTDNNRMMMYC